MVRVQRLFELGIERAVHGAELLGNKVHGVDAGAVARPALVAEDGYEFAVAIVRPLFLGWVRLVEEQRDDVVQFAAADGEGGGIVEAVFAQNLLGEFDLALGFAAFGRGN